MTLDATKLKIQATLEQMNARYGAPVFDEWAILLFEGGKGRVLAYHGPRKAEFGDRFSNDLGGLRAELTNARYTVGDFEFARHGAGTQFEAFMVLGEGAYLICNHTGATMDQIAKDPRWLNAQVPFAEFSEAIRANPLAVPA